MTRPIRGDDVPAATAPAAVSAVWRRYHHRPCQRRKQAHDRCHDWIWVRRGICHPCSKTFTILPDWLAPSGHFSVCCRQQACAHIAAGDCVEQAAPTTGSRIPTVVPANVVTETGTELFPASEVC